MAQIDTYLDRVTPYWRGKAKFMATLRAVLQPFVDANNVIGGLPADFDLDDAVGVQLDAVGIRVGCSRLIPVPLPDTWFSFDNDLYGFDRAPWKGPFDSGTSFSRLDDDTYRRLLRAKILANQWDGTIPAAQAALDAFFIDPLTHVFILDGAAVANQQLFFSFDNPPRGFDLGVWFQDGQVISNLRSVDLTMSIVVSGKIPNIIDLAVLNQMMIPIKPEGVQLDIEVTSIDGWAVFGFDVENEFISGFDVASWGVSPEDSLTGVGIGSGAIGRLSIGTSAIGIP
ncbi:DUF2612 domain-containing protein [Labrys neptuniae]